MANEETELRHAEQLDRVVENIVRGDCDLFEGVQARRLPHNVMTIVDLATFIMPLEPTESKTFEQRMFLLTALEAQRLKAARDPGPRKAVGILAHLVNPILGVGLAIAAFCAALFLEPMPAGREGRSIDTLGRPWYNVTIGKYLVGSVDSDIGRLSYLGFSDAGFGYRAIACR